MTDPSGPIGGPVISVTSCPRSCWPSQESSVFSCAPPMISRVITWTIRMRDGGKVKRRRRKVNERAKGGRAVTRSQLLIAGIGLVIAAMAVLVRSRAIAAPPPSTSPGPTTAQTMADIKSLFFADDLNEWLPRIPPIKPGDPVAPDDPWPRLRRASELIAEKRNDEARGELNAVLMIPKLETRVRLLACSGLRLTGVRPPDEDRVVGVVLEVPVDDGIDTLAAYDDRRARYVNQSERLVVWEAEDPQVDVLIDRLIRLANDNVTATERVVARDRSTTANVRITLLTPAGSRVAEVPMRELSRSDHPLSGLFLAGANVLKAVVDRALEGQPKQPPAIGGVRD